MLNNEIVTNYLEDTVTYDALRKKWVSKDRFDWYLDHTYHKNYRNLNRDDLALAEKT